MITDEQVCVACAAYDSSDVAHSQLAAMRKALEAYEQSKWVEFNVNDESTYPQKSGHHIVFDGRGVSYKYWDNTEDEKRFRNQSWFVSESVNFKKATHWQPLPTFKE